MYTRAELDDVPYEDKKWLKAIPKHLWETALAIQDMFELQPSAWRQFPRSKMRVWMTEMRNRAWLAEQHSKRERGVSLYTTDPIHLVIVDAATDAPGLCKDGSVDQPIRRKRQVLA